MKRLIKPVTPVLPVLLIGLGVAAAQTTTSTPPTVVKKVPVQPTLAMAGKDLYREYCAVCHGLNGKGDGPAASALKIPPANLTLIAKSNGGKFPELQVEHIINGDADEPVAHGLKDMPVWGNLFRHMGPAKDVAAVRVFNLMKYIEEIQAK